MQYSKLVFLWSQWRIVNYWLSLHYVTWGPPPLCYKIVYFLETLRYLRTTTICYRCVYYIGETLHYTTRGPSLCYIQKYCLFFRNFTLLRTTTLLQECVLGVRLYVTLPEDHHYGTLTACDHHKPLPDHQSRRDNHTKVKHLVIQLKENRISHQSP